MAFKQNRRIRRYFLLTVTAFFLLLLTACGGGNSDSSIAADADNGTGELSFDVIFQDDDEDRQRQAAVTDCAGLGIATVEAMVYDQGNNFLVGGGPWDCDSGQGTVTAVPAGSDRIVAILAKDSEGRLVYRGQKSEVNVLAGESNNIGTVKCKAFVLSLQAPTDASLVQADAVGLEWHAVAGASEYRVIISENGDLSDPVINSKTQNVTYTPSDLTIGTTYYWQIVPIDMHSNHGMGSQIWTFTVRESIDNSHNLLLDPTFSKTTSNGDQQYWNWVPAMEWGSTYGHNSSPGFRCTIDGNQNWIGELDGEGNNFKHPVKAGDKLWIQLRVKRSIGADGIFRVGIQERDRDENYIKNTLINVSTIAAYDTWELVTTSVTVSDVNTAFCHLSINPYGGTKGYFFIDDVYFSNIEPQVTIYDRDNMIQDPEFNLTQSNTDNQFWGMTEPNTDLELNTFNIDGQVAPNGNRAVKILNRTTPTKDNWLWEYDNLEARWNYRTFPVTSESRFYVQAKVFESIDSDAEDDDFKAVILVGDNNRAYTSFNAVPLRPSVKGVWETVSGETSIWKPNFDIWTAWDSGTAYNAGDVIKYDGGISENMALYRCLNDGTSGVGTEPSNPSYWVRADDSKLGNFGIVSENCTTGFFLVDDVILSRIHSSTSEPNILFDPDFSVTTSNTDQQHWAWAPAMEWGATYGYNSTPGIRCAIDGNENWLAELDGSYNNRKHPVKLYNKLWIQCRVKKSGGADGVFRVGIQERDKYDVYIRNTLTDVPISAADEEWEVVTASVAVSDPKTAFCHLLIYPYGGTTGYFFIDDVVFSRHEPAAH